MAYQMKRGAAPKFKDLGAEESPIAKKGTTSSDVDVMTTSPLTQMEITREDAYSHLPDDYSYTGTDGTKQTLGKDDRHGTLTVSADGTKVISSTTKSSGKAHGEGSLGGWDISDTSVGHHAAILKQRYKQANTATGGNLNALIAKRKKLTKGTAGYAEVQNQINKAFGSSKVHAVTTKTPRSEKRTLKKEKRLSRREERISKRIERREEKGKGTTRAQKRLKKVQEKKSKLY
mgnify:CR=1 FL=1